MEAADGGQTVIKQADMASVDSSLPNIFQEAKNVTDNEINRLNELIDNADVNP